MWDSKNVILELIKKKTETKRGKATKMNTSRIKKKQQTKRT